MKSFLSLSFALLLIPLSVIAADSDNYNNALNKLKSKTGAQVSNSNGWTLVLIKGETPYTIWSFTPKDHPAHPAFARRTITQEKAGAWRVKTDMSCNGTKVECDKLMVEYKALDEKMKKDINKTVKP